MSRLEVAGWRSLITFCGWDAVSSDSVVTKWGGAGGVSHWANNAHSLPHWSAALISGGQPLTHLSRHEYLCEWKADGVSIDRRSRIKRLGGQAHHERAAGNRVWPDEEVGTVQCCGVTPPPFGARQLRVGRGLLLLMPHVAARITSAIPAGSRRQRDGGLSALTLRTEGAQI